MPNIYDKIKKKLHDRPIKIIGLGGIGAPVSLYVSKFLYSLKSDATLFLIDGDEFELDNKERMAFKEYGKKAEVKEAELAEIFGERVNFRALPDYVTKENIDTLLRASDIIFLCVDNHATRKLVSEHCAGLSEILLISGGNDGVENGKTGTFGNIQIFWREKGKDKTNSLTRFHPEIAQPEDHVPGESKDESCAVLVQKVPQLAFTNLAVASAMLNSLLVWARGKLTYEEVYLDILSAKTVPISRNVKTTKGCKSPS